MRQGFDKLLLDPPRSGALEVLQQLPLKTFERIVYVSCHPGSLARDAGYLVNEQGFTLVSAGAMDMFPHTATWKALRCSRGGDWGFGIGDSQERTRCLPIAAVATRVLESDFKTRSVD